MVGQQVRCPKCEYIVQVEFDGSEAFGDKLTGHQRESDRSDSRSNPPTSQENAGNSGQSTPCDNWFLRIPEGHEFGPISLTELDKWVAEGRVSTDCQIRNSDPEWQSAADFYPELVTEGSTSVPSGSSEPARHVLEAQGRVPQVLEPHRGGFILSLAFAGCVVPFLSVWPAVICTRDLQRMSVGKMDLRGEAMTRSGQAIAMVASMIWFGAFVIGLLAVLIRAMSRYSA